MSSVTSSSTSSITPNTGDTVFAVVPPVQTEATLSPIQQEVQNEIDQLVTTQQTQTEWDAFDQELRVLYNLKSHETGAQGNCQFHVIAFVLHQCGIDKSHTLVRQEVCNEMVTHNELYQGFVPTTDGEDAETSYAAFVERQRTDGEWGGHVTLQAACNVYGLSLMMFRPNEFPVHFQPDVRANNTLPHKHGNIAFFPEIHYRGTVEIDTDVGVIKPKNCVSFEATQKNKKQVTRFTEQEKKQKRRLLHRAMEHDNVDVLKQLFDTAEDVRNATWWMHNHRNDKRPAKERKTRHTGTRHLIDELCQIRDEHNKGDPRMQCLRWTLTTFPDAYTESDINYCVNEIKKKMKNCDDAMMESKYEQLLNCVQAHLDAMQSQEADTDKI